MNFQSNFRNNFRFFKSSTKNFGYFSSRINALSQITNLHNYMHLRQLAASKQLIQNISAENSLVTFTSRLPTKSSEISGLLSLIRELFSVGSAAALINLSQMVSSLQWTVLAVQLIEVKGMPRAPRWGGEVVGVIGN